uniref:Uncharacterized protein n=1 Tax=Amphilophus citrinellus TaxID=61819 RepID=A0A3Q0R9C6_AMPCI
MKTVILTVLVLLAVSQSEALKCNCGGDRQCSGPVETCRSSNDVCFSLIINAGSMVKYSKGCMDASDCSFLNQPPLTISRCCRYDLCN